MKRCSRVEVLDCFVFALEGSINDPDFETLSS